MKKKVKISLLVLVPIILIVGVVVLLRVSSKLSPTSMQDVTVSTKTTAGKMRIVIHPRAKNVFLTTEISGSDDYQIYTRHFLPWESPKRALILTYQKDTKNAVITRPNDSKVPADAKFAVRLIYSNGEEKLTWDLN
ncbi:hypothetical protein ACFQHW_03690 [Lapidilactobacillus achengensis]|uniref:Uncharacterized protein n=1 Tax=Lapidilactobacillus achengensis TaxID=2486000 RepID=A0ABW1UL43_9LACO|nr:hypothetical protein [Lapidilactobacillus achengensis]